MLPPVEPVESHLAFSTMLHATFCRNVPLVEYRLKRELESVGVDRYGECISDLKF